MASFQISHHMLCLPQSHGRTAAFMALCNETVFQIHFMKTDQLWVREFGFFFQANGALYEVLPHISITSLPIRVPRYFTLSQI